MKKTRIWLILLVTLAPTLAMAGDLKSVSVDKATQPNHKVEAIVCGNSWMQCFLSKMLSGQEPMLLGPGVGGDP